MFQDFGASLLSFTMANPTDFQAAFFFGRLRAEMDGAKRNCQ